MHVNATNAFRTVCLLLLCSAPALVALAGAPSAHAQAASGQPMLDFQRGPATFPIGGDLAEIDLSADYVFLDKANTERLMEFTGNPLNGSEQATVLPASDAEQWFLVFEWEPIGYVEDEESDLDADALIESIREGTAAANEERAARGWSTMEIVGWHEEPNYDADTKNLTWAIVGSSAGEQNINRMVKVLGRRGVMSLTLVAAPHELAAADAQLAGLIDRYRFQPGSTYAEYVPGKDKLAEIGLAALVVGGTGAVLAKSGLLARFWKWIVVGVVGLGGAIRRFFTGRRAEDEPVSQV